MILVGAAIMEWRFGSVKEKTRQFGEEEGARQCEESGLALQADRENSWRLLNWVLSVVRSVCF
jgi:hypothetical protein